MTASRIAMTSSCSSDEDEADPVGDEGGLRLVLDFDGDLVNALPLPGPLLLHPGEEETAADTAACSHRGKKTNPVEAVIEAHPKRLGREHRICRHAAEQRQGEKTMRDRAA